MTTPDRIEEPSNLDRIEELTRALAQKDAIIGAFFDLSPDLFSVASMETGCFIQVNKSWERVTGWTAAELTSKPFVEFVHPDDLNATNDEFNELKREGISHTNFKNRYVCRDGSLVSLSWRTTPPIDGVVFASARVIESNNDQIDKIDRLKINRHIVRSCAESVAPLVTQLQLVQDRLMSVYDDMKAESQ